MHRYWILILPPGCVAIPSCITSIAHWAAIRWRRQRLVYFVTAVFVVTLAAHPLPALWRMYAVRSQVHPTNREMESLAVLVQNAARPGEVVMISELVLARAELDESYGAATLWYLLLLDRLSSLLLPAGAESPYDYALAHPEQTYLLIVPLSTPIPNNADRSRGAPGTPFEIDARSPSKELGLAVNLVHFRSE